MTLPCDTESSGESQVTLSPHRILREARNGSLSTPGDFLTNPTFINEHSPLPSSPLFNSLSPSLFSWLFKLSHLSQQEPLPASARLGLSNPSVLAGIVVL